MKDDKQPDHPPAGQPYASPLVKVVERPSGRSAPLLRYPHQIVKIRTKGDLVQALRHYSHPFPQMEGSSPHVKGKDGARYMVEWVFPSLRWYCKVYGTEIPVWLEGNGWASNLDEQEHYRFFGKSPLRVREFRESKVHTGTRA